MSTMGNKHRRSYNDDDESESHRGNTYSNHRSRDNRRGSPTMVEDHIFIEPKRDDRKIAVPPVVNSTYNDRPNKPAPAQPAVTGEPETVKVKWFNTEKGFGFVTDANGRDLFLHVSVLKDASITEVAPDQELTVQRGPGRDGKGESANRIIVTA